MHTQATVTNRISELCREEHAELLSGLNNRTAWSKEGDLGYGNQVVSAAHDNRTVLELIQNARDAIAEGGEETDGRIAVIVGPESLLVANSGEPFRLDDGEVFEAVTSLGRSAKAKDRGSIGEKGVGLKSILQLSEAFSIHSSVGEEQFSAKLSRAQTAEMVLAMYGTLLSEDSFIGRLEGSDEQRELIENCRSLGPEQSAVPDYIDSDELIDRLLADRRHTPPTPAELLSDLPRLSLFRYPFLGSDEKSDSSLLPRHLIQNRNSDSTPEKRTDERLSNWLGERQGEFSTVVELDYLDHQWRDLLDQIDGILAASDGEAASTFRDHRSSDPVDRTEFHERRQREFWRECTNISPETLILLDQITELDLIRVTRDDSGTLQMADRHQVTIQPGSAQPIAGQPNTIRRSVNYTVRADDQSTRTRQYRQYTRTYEDLVSNDGEGEPGNIQLLFERPPESIADWTPSAKPLYLHYPIEKARTPFPFVVHAPFRVEFDRQSLADDEQNRRVLNRLPELVASAAADLATSDETRASDAPFSSWMPWITMPLQAESDVNDDNPVTNGIQDVLRLLRETPIVPAEGASPQAPKDTLLDPERLYAFEALRRDAPEAPIPSRTTVEAGRKWRQRISESDNESSEAFRRCASRLGLTEILERLFDDESSGERGCIDILCTYWSSNTDTVSSSEWAVPVENVEHATSYFEAICSILRSASPGEELDLDNDSDVKRAAEKLGEKRVPLIPAEAHQEGDAAESRGVTHLVRARSRRDTQRGRGARRSERIVFRRTGSGQNSKSIISELPSPPTALPVFVVPFRTEWVGPLESFNRDWGTRNLDSPAEFYRRVAAEAGGYSGDPTADPSVIGYLSDLYETVTRGQLAEWLHPLPHRNHRFDDVENTLTGASTDDLPSDYDDYLERRYTQQVELPIDGSGGTDETLAAEQIMFGTEWVTEFEAVADVLETADSDKDRFRDADSYDGSRATTFRRWAAVIENASSAAPPETPTLAGPDEDYWQRVFDGETGDRYRVQRLDFLIHLGVQIGPRIDWRWVLPTRGDNDRGAGTLSVSEAQALARGEVPDDHGGFNAPRELLTDYRDVIWRSDNHPAFTATHSPGCGNNWLECSVENWAADDSKEALLPVWWYFTDLPRITDTAAREQYRDAIVLLWPDLIDTVSDGAWLCSNWHSFSESPDNASVPSLGVVQLARENIWPVDKQFEDEGGNDRHTVERGTTASAEKLILDESEQVRGAAQYLPRVDTATLEERLAYIPGSETVDVRSFLRTLGIREIGDLTPPMAAQRLDWFLKQFAVDDTRVPPGNSFEIAADWSARALSVPIDALMRRLASERELTTRLDDQSAIRRWIRRDLWHLGTTVRVTEGRTSKGLQIGSNAHFTADEGSTPRPVVFTQPLSSFSRDRLVRDSRPFVERPADTTEVAYILGDEENNDQEATEVTFGITVESEPPTPRPVQGGEVESGTERLDSLQSTLRQRQQYLLAAYLEHAAAPNLQEKHEQLSAVIENQIAIVERDEDDDTQRNSAQWEPTEGYQDSTPHIALFEDSVERVDGDAIPPYLAADGIVQVLEQFDLADTFENVLFKDESALETEYHGALEDVRAEINELREQRLKGVYNSLESLVSTVASDESLTRIDDLDIDARVTLNALRELEAGKSAIEGNTLLESWFRTLTGNCGLNEDIATKCLRAAATDDDAVRHQIIYQLDQNSEVVDVDALVETGHQWRSLEAWPATQATRQIESYSAIIARLRRFWEGVGEYEDAGESTLERAASDARDVSSAPKPTRRVARFIPQPGSLDPAVRNCRLGSLPVLETDPSPLEQLSTAVSEWLNSEWTDLKESDIVYTDPQLETRIEALIEAAATPRSDDGNVDDALAALTGSEQGQSPGDGQTRGDLTTDWIHGRDDSLDSLASRVSAAGSVTGGGSPSIGDSSGTMYGQPNVEIDARGREGELICLNRAWSRFQPAPSQVRSSILDHLRTWRGHDAWRMKSVDEIAASWNSPNLDSQTSSHPVDLLKAERLDETSEAKAAFHALFDTSAERGPGFDLIDPFAEMPESASIASWSPGWMCRVESKAVAAEQMRSGRIKLTGNELRMSFRDGPGSTKSERTDESRVSQYIIRLVGFTTDWRGDDSETVQLLDIDNVDELVGVNQTGMEILEKLRGGSFYITFTADSV